MATRVAFCSTASAIVVTNMTGTSYSWAATVTGTFWIIVTITTGTAHDSAVTIGGVALASQYFTYNYQRLNCIVNVYKGTQIIITGATGDNIQIVRAL